MRRRGLEGEREREGEMGTCIKTYKNPWHVIHLRARGRGRWRRRDEEDTELDDDDDLELLPAEDDDEEEVEEDEEELEEGERFREAPPPPPAATCLPRLDARCDCFPVDSFGAESATPLPLGFTSPPPPPRDAALVEGRVVEGKGLLDRLSRLAGGPVVREHYQFCFQRHELCSLPMLLGSVTPLGMFWARHSCCGVSEGYDPLPVWRAPVLVVMYANEAYYRQCIAMYTSPPLRPFAQCVCVCVWMSKRCVARREQQPPLCNALRT